VGGTDFDDFTTQNDFLETRHSQRPGHPRVGLGYIHEIPWNDSCAATATSANLSTVCAGTAATNIVGEAAGLAASMRAPFRDTQNLLGKVGFIPQRIAAGD